MSSSGSDREHAASAGGLVEDVRMDGDRLSVDLADGRTITVPLRWYPRLLEATPTERANWTISGAGHGVHWPELDEDLSVEGLLHGAPSPQGDRTRRT